MKIESPNYKGMSSLMGETLEKIPQFFFVPAKEIGGHPNTFLALAERSLIEIENRMFVRRVG
jgi:hypothetical protein